MAMNTASGAMPIVPLALLANGTGNSSTTVDWTRYKMVWCVFYPPAGGTIAVALNGNGYGNYAVPSNLPFMFLLTLDTASNYVVGSGFGGNLAVGGARQTAHAALSWTSTDATTTYTIYGVAVR